MVKQLNIGRNFKEHFTESVNHTRRETSSREERSVNSVAQLVNQTRDDIIFVSLHFLSSQSQIVERILNWPIFNVVLGWTIQNQNPKITHRAILDIDFRATAVTVSTSPFIFFLLPVKSVGV